MIFASMLVVGLSAVPPGVIPWAAENRPGARVKTAWMSVNGSEVMKGIVGSIDADGVVLVVISESLEVKEHRFKPIEVLRKGGVIDTILARFAYRWEDVKAGDTVMLRVADDHIDKEWYCMAIHIVRRPKGRLPASQLEEEDTAFPARRIVNDIDNGVDVSDEEILKVYPPQKEKRVGDTLLEPARLGGLNAEWKAKLDAIRAKKKDDLKATPPDKK